MRISGTPSCAMMELIAVLDGRVDDALALDDDLDLLRGQTEQPDGFDQFQTLVHQGGRVNGHPSPPYSNWGA